MQNTMSQQEQPKQCFSSIQSRKVWATACPSTCRLCPSMDLVVLGMQQPTDLATEASMENQKHQHSHSSLESAVGTTGSTVARKDSDASAECATSLWIHRTVSWQKLATLTFEKGRGVSHVTWSPDGRHLALAIADKGEVQMYQVESLSGGVGGVGAGSAAAAYGGSSNSAAAAVVLDIGVRDTEDHSFHTAPDSDSNVSRTEQDKNVGTSTPTPSLSSSRRIIQGLSWAHVGRPHPKAWRLSDDQVEEQVSWRYRSRYVDRSSVFLPPSEYHQDNAHGATGTTKTGNTLPTCKTPLSLLCVSTDKCIELYLHGRFHLLSLPRTASERVYSNVEVVCSNDLTQLVVHEQGSCRLSLYSLPSMDDHCRNDYNNRYHLQTIASLHSSITSHLAVMRQSIPEIADSWKSSLKPLDAKLEPLQRLLSNYGVCVGDGDETMGSVLRQYILIGHTGASSNIANAMDQFFTSVQMNDQLLQRMERSLQGALANLESLVRKGLLSPARALVYHVGELGGLVRYQQQEISTTTSTSNGALNPVIALEHSSEMVLVSVEALLTEVVDSRFRLRDFVAWLRSTGSQIKARGTAAQSVQRDNAKKRRVPQAVVQRMLTYLKSSDEGKVKNTNKPVISGSLTEGLLGINVSDLLRGNPRMMVSPLNDVTMSDENSTSQGQAATSTAVGLQWLNRTPTVTTMTNEAEQAAELVFSQPRHMLSQSALPRDVILPSAKTDVPIAMLTRIGKDPSLANEEGAEDGFDDSDDYDEEQRTFFSPKVVIRRDFDSMSSSFDCRQWVIIAQAGKSARSSSKNSESCYCATLQLFALPLGWKDPNLNDDDDDDSDSDDEHIDVERSRGSSERCSGGVPFYLTTTLLLPPSHAVQDLGFYSDDGKSSLSSGTDSGTGKEGRQKFGFLVSSPIHQNDDYCSAQTAGERSDNNDDNNDDNNNETQKLEMWLLEYDDLPWQAIQFHSSLMCAQEVDEYCRSTLRPISQESEDGDEMEGDENVVLAQTREITVLEPNTPKSSVMAESRLMLSGSRGIGGVILKSMGATTLELLDLEDDDDCDDDDEEGDEEVDAED